MMHLGEGMAGLGHMTRKRRFDNKREPVPEYASPPTVDERKVQLDRWSSC
jgi:hypothetical protein